MAGLPSARRLESIREQALDAVALPDRIGRYRVLGELGRGGMGLVYDAWDDALARPVAVKVVRCGGGEDAGRSERLARLLTEMRATSRIFDPHVVAVLDAGLHGEDDGAELYFVMERIEGPSLEEQLCRVGKLSRAEGLRIGAAVARGLACAHARGLVHRDLKPSNVLLPATGSAKIADFGLVQVREELALPRGEELCGSAHYIAPEQVRSGAVGPAADLFSLGAMLVRIWSGRDPFPAASLAQHLERIVHGAPDGLDAIDPDLCRLVERLLEKDPSHRPASAALVARELEALARAGGEGDEARPPAPRWRRAVGAGALAALAGLLLAWGGHEQLARLDRSAALQWQQVQNQLERRRSLLPRVAELGREASEAAAALPGGPPADGRVLAFEVAGTENRIAVERARYNESALRLNDRLARAPWRWLAGSIEPRPVLPAPGETWPSPAAAR